MPIQDHAQQIEIYEVLNLDVPHGNYSLHYDIEDKYLGITLGETSAIEILENQFQTCKKANGQFCVLNMSLLPLDNPPTCLLSLYANDKNSIQKRCSLQVMKANSVSIPTPIAPNVWIITSSPPAASAGVMLICPGEAPRVLMPQTPIHILRLKPACSPTSQYFHLSPRYESHDVSINVSLNTANLNVVNISALEFRIWQHLEGHWNRTSLQHLTNITSVPLDELYKQMITGTDPCTHFYLMMSQQEKQFQSGHCLLIQELYGNGYRITHTSRIRDILLLLLLVLTCQISAPTFTIRFYMIYYCGW